MTDDGRDEKPVIRYALSRSMLGRMLVARTDRGICYAAFGDEPRALERALRGRFTGVRIERDDTGLKDAVQTVARMLCCADDDVRPALDLRGTPFQLEVWKLLRTIPPGRTATYTELARKMGRPRAVRAVANACAANPVAVVVPCHRVVRSDGGLGGYYWGIERKRRLLQWEADMVQKPRNGKPAKGRGRDA
jgi:AraC family transcriptional regulator of adaptative response/methylated-DNA-[protein]-cysteine methyltransferase